MRIPTLGIIVLMACCGCNSSSDPTISGNVTVDSVPLAYGSIVFRSSDGTKPMAGSPVNSGAYKIDSLPTGEYQVKIQAGFDYDTVETVNQQGVKDGEPVIRLQNARGNNQVVNIEVTRTDLDFSLSTN